MINFNEWYTLKEENNAIESNILNAYYKISNGQKTRVRLADIKNTLRSIPKEELDNALISLASKGKIALMQFDNPMEKTPADKEAELVLPTGYVRHVMYVV